MSYLSQLKDKIKDIDEVDVLTEEDIWSKHGNVIWKSNRFSGDPSFYPIYKWNDFYSYSILALILKKNSLALNDGVNQYIENRELAIIPDNLTIDREITRVGKPHDFSYLIGNVGEYCEKITKALKQDVKDIEDNNPGYLNIVMCGGKDSLNLLLLPWSNPVVALSAEPNYKLVCEFVRSNDLDMKVEKLEDLYDEDMLEDEILEACCRADLSHWRWGIHLRKIVQKHSQKVVIWKGQLGDVYMSPTWKSYIYPKTFFIQFICKVYKKTSHLLPKKINKLIGRLIQPEVVKTTWNKSASLQGCHVGFIRALCDCLVLSSYHGKNVMNVFANAELGLVAQDDIRPIIGELLLGKEVTYPQINPAPKESGFRAGKNSIENFLQMIKKSNIKVNN